MSLYDWIYWGPKDVLEAYFKDPQSLKDPIIRVKLSDNVAQTGPNSFSVERELQEEHKRIGSSSFSQKLMWGNYPVLGLRSLVDDKFINIAWVGLNDPEGQWTLMFNLVCPDSNGHPDRGDREFWKRFLTQTKVLPEPEFFKAYGQDMRPGYTLVNSGGARFKMIAEKRKRDSMVQLVVIPLASTSSFEYIDMGETRLASQWKYGEPLLKVLGTIKLDDENLHAVFRNHVSSILLQNVTEFSVDKDEAILRKDLVIYQKLGNVHSEDE
jgi:hypothetical protein